jgi:hypothetical protein
MSAIPRPPNGKTWRETFRRGLVSGAIASVVSAAALALCGRLEGGTAGGPLNGPSQWLFGRRAARRRSASPRHTFAGYAIHHVAATWWAVVHETLFGRTNGRADPLQVLREAAATAAIACVVDYRLTPKRLQPGFEQQLTRTSLVVAYAAFALGLALGRAREHSRG